jgi:mannosyl-oligosaccharide alpha-1,3-glucosidase
MKIVEAKEGKAEEDDITLDKILLYIRGGTVFARKDNVRRSSSSMKYDPFTIVIAFNSNGEARGSLYIDDGDSYDYQEKLAFARVQIYAKLNDHDGVLALKLDVEGKSSLLPENILYANRIILIDPSKSEELKVDLNIGESKDYEFKL